MDQKDSTNTDKPLSNRDRAILKDELLSELVAGCQSESDLFGPDGVFTRLKGAVMEKLLEAEMTAHLGHEPHERRKGSNSRNGHSGEEDHGESGVVDEIAQRSGEHQDAAPCGLDPDRCCGGAPSRVELPGNVEE